MCTFDNRDCTNGIISLNGHLLIGCQSAVHVIQIGSRTRQRLPLRMKLCRLVTSDFNGKCYGIVEDPRNQTMSLQEYDVEKNEWHHISDLPCQVKFNVIAISDEQFIYIIGHVTQDGRSLNLIQRYSVQWNTWVRPLQMPQGHANCTVAISQSILYIADEQDHHVATIPLTGSALHVRVPPIPSAFSSGFRIWTIHQQLFCIGDNNEALYVLYQPITAAPSKWYSLTNLPKNLLGVEACRINDTSAAIMGSYVAGNESAVYILKWN